MRCLSFSQGDKILLTAIDGGIIGAMLVSQGDKIGLAVIVGDIMCAMMVS